MSRRLLLVAAVAIFLGAGILAISLPPRLICASLSHPEGTRCREGRIDFDDHGPFVSVHVDRRFGPRLAILGSGVVAATVLLLRDRRDEGANVAPMKSGGAGL